MLTAFSKTAKTMVKRAAITGALEAANIFGGSRFGVSSPGFGIIFTLHHVRPKTPQPFNPNAHLEITPEFLAQAIEVTLDRGYRPISLEDLPEHMSDPNPEKPVVVFTLDDGYANNLQHALPVFEKYGVPFTVFVTTGFMDHTHAPWWETLVALLNHVPKLVFDFGQGPVAFDLTVAHEKQLALEKIIEFAAGSNESAAVEVLNQPAREHGFDPLEDKNGLIMCPNQTQVLASHPLARVGAHSVSHRNLRRLSAEEAGDEMARSADRIAQVVGYRPVSFAYPYGFHAAVSQREIDLARDIGFKIAVTTRPGILKADERSKLTSLPRVSLNGLYQKQRYVRALTSGIPFRFMK